MTIVSKKKQDKYVTVIRFEQSMASIARSFDRVDERFDRYESVLDEILIEMQAMRQEFREDRQTMAALAYNDINQEKTIKDLTERMRIVESRG